MSVKLEKNQGCCSGISPAEEHSAENDLPKLQHNAEKSAIAQSAYEEGESYQASALWTEGDWSQAGAIAMVDE
jgi:hypothetical protein